MNTQEEAIFCISRAAYSKEICAVLIGPAALEDQLSELRAAFCRESGVSWDTASLLHFWDFVEWLERTRGFRAAPDWLDWAF